MSEDLEAQSNELLALKSIYADFFQSDASEGISYERSRGGEVRILLDLPHPFFVSVEEERKEDLQLCVEYLPPVFLNFSFPSNYPSREPPAFTLSCKWLSVHQLSTLCHRLDEVWEENVGAEVIFMWVQCLKEGTFGLLGITDHLILSPVCHEKHKIVLSLDWVNTELSCEKAANGAQGSSPVNHCDMVCDSRAVQDVGPGTNLLRVLKDFDEEMRRKVFQSRTFDCKVCFQNKSGVNCIEFWPCRHTYCKECMRCYFETQMKEGKIRSLLCPEENCHSEANPKQVENLVPKELYVKWEEMLLTSTLSSLDDIQYCPRKHCQYPVTMENNEGHCPACQFVFCGLCRYTWHGREKCRFRDGEAEKILEIYAKGDAIQKLILEDKYGKACLIKMLNEYLTFSYLRNNTKKCPRCQSSIEKLDGCNKMNCQFCNTNFCWLCCRILDNLNPYSHFNNPRSECFNLLFHGIDVFDDNNFEFDGSDDNDDDLEV